MRDLNLIYVLRFSFLAVLLTIYFSVVSDYEFSNDILYAFPMYSLVVPIKNLREKNLIFLIYPILVNIILWIPLKKSYSSIYGMLYIEKWKTFLVILWFLFILLTTSLFGRVSDTNVIWGMIISGIYYCFLRYSLKCLRRDELLIHLSVEKKGLAIEWKKFSFIFGVHVFTLLCFILKYSFWSIEGNVPVYKVKLPEKFYRLVKDITSDGRKIISLTGDVMGPPSEEKSLRRIEVFDVEKEVEYTILNPGNIGFVKLFRNGKYIVYSMVNEDVKKEELLIYDFETGEKIDEYNILETSIPMIREVKFNEDGKLLFVDGGGKCILRRINGKVVYFFNGKDSEDEFIWLSKDEYIIYRSHISKGQQQFLHFKIMHDENIKVMPKTEISSDLERKYSKVWNAKIYIKPLNEKKICIITSGIPYVRWFNYYSDITFWDLECQTKIFSVNSSHEIINAIFIKEKKCLIVFERLKNGKVRMTFWNTDKREKERVIHIDDMGKYDGRNIRLINDGDRIIDVGWMSRKEYVKTWDVR